MNNFKSYIKSRQFYINLGLIIILIFAVIYFSLGWLSSYTRHGEFVVVPDFKGQKLQDLEKFVADKEVGYQIIDSLYDPKEKAGIVLRQDPEMNSKVKHNRTVYLYVTGMVPPQVSMPKLVDRSERQARLILHSYGLKLGRLEEKHADCSGCVLEQIYKGRAIEPGKNLPKGSVVDLVIGIKDGGYVSSPDTLSTNNEDPEQ